jgi:hypothetical protein
MIDRIASGNPNRPYVWAYSAKLVPRQATFALSMTARSWWSLALRFRQMM